MIDRFCIKCGKRLKYMGLSGAENFGILYIGDSKYDAETGKRKMRKWYECPNKPKRFRSWKELFDLTRHDSIAIGRDILV